MTMTLPTRSLDDLAVQISREHEAAEGALKAALHHARDAGQLLIEAKRQVRHGEWGEWLAANVRFSARTAQGYTRIARRWTDLESKTQRVAELPVRDALALLAEPAGQPSARNLPQEMRDQLAALDLLRETFSRDVDVEISDIIASATTPYGAIVQVKALVDEPLRSGTLRRLYDHLRKCDDLADELFESISGLLNVPAAELRGWTPKTLQEIQRAATERAEALA